jgi:hypothetical protein
MQISQAKALTMQPVQVRGLDNRVPVTTQITVSLIISNYKYNVWLTTNTSLMLKPNLIIQNLVGH